MKVPFLRIATVIFATCVITCSTAPSKQFSNNKYLAQFGYLDLYDESPTVETLTKAVTDFQKYAKIPVTGKLDNTTVAKLIAPRCGARDKQGDREKRAASQGFWKRHNLTYSFHGFPTMKITDRDVKKTLARSFKAWEDVTPLTFQKLEDNDETADIVIKFVAGLHEDSYGFDGPGKIVAHAFYPLENTGLDGDLHFDDDEVWTIDGESGTTDLSWTALHELGHSIGLDHTSTEKAIMWPWYPGYRTENKLHQDDIETVQSIYGRANRVTWINICNVRNIDAVLFDKKTESSYFFKEDQVWMVSRRRKIIKQDAISNMWPGLEDNIDAAYSTKNGDVIFFKGNRLWRYQNFTKIEGPHPLVTHIINAFESGINKIEAAMVWVKDQKTYFFNKEQYWRYDEDERTIDPGYPKKSSVFWKNLKFPVDGVMSWRKGKTFFFNNENFYAFNNKKNILKIKRKKLRQRIGHFIKTCRK